MALTRVAPAGIGSTPGTGYAIGDSFLHSTGLNATNAYYTGIVTSQNIRVLGDLQVDGTTTTLDTAVTEVDKLEVEANNTTVGVAITQSGSGDILNLYDGSNEVFSVADGGAVTTTGDISVGGDLTLPDAIVHSGDTDTKIRFPADDTVTVETAGSERLRIDSGGRIGIGEDNPVSKLDVKGSAANTVDIRLRNTESNAQMSLYAFGGTAATGSHFNNRIAMMSWSDTEGIDMITNGTGDNDFRVYTGGYGTNSERFRITSAGLVGINTNNPQKTLHVNSSADNSFSIVRISGKNRGGQLEFCTDATKTAGIYSPTNSNELIFFTSSSETERLRITSDGKVLINSTANSNATMVVKGLTDNTHPVIKFRGTSDNGYTFFGDEYQTDESQFTMGCAYSAASIVIGWGVKVSTSANNVYLSSQDTYATKHSAIRHDGNGWAFLSNSSSQTVTTDSAVTLTERLRITSDGAVNIGDGTPNADGSGALNVYSGTSGALSQFVHSAGNGGLRIGGTGSGSAANLVFSNNYNSNSWTDEWTIRMDGSDDSLRFLSGGVTATERLRITSAGLVGINCTPQKILDVLSASDDFVSVGSRTLGIGQWTGIHFGYREDNTVYRKSAIVFERVDGSARGKVHILNNNGSTNASATLSDAKLTILSDGKVSVGGVEPVRNFHVYSNSSTTARIHATGNNSYAQIEFMHEGDSSTWIFKNGSTQTGYAGASSWNFYNPHNSAIAFYTNTTEKVRISGDGKLGVGVVPTDALHVQTSNTTGQFRLGGNNTGHRIYINSHPTSSYIDCYGSSAYQPFKIDASPLYLNGTSGGDVVIGGTGATRAKLDVRVASGHPAFNIGFPDGSIYRNLGTVGPNDTLGNNVSNGGQYLHIRLRTIWNDSSMTMFRLTGYYSYSSYAESYVGMYRYAYSGNRTTPYGQIISNQGNRTTVHSIYNTTADPGYLVIVCDWGTHYTGLMIEHNGAGGSYGSGMQQDVEIIDTKRSTSTSAQW